MNRLQYAYNNQWTYNRSFSNFGTYNINFDKNGHKM